MQNYPAPQEKSLRFGGDKYKGLKHAQIYIERSLQIVGEI